jgi:predicted nucleic acid-binding protein
MSAERVTLDTNILIYSVDTDAGDRQSQARELVHRTARHYDSFLTLQTLSEFFAAVTRKEKLSPSEAAEQVADYQKLFPVVAANPDSLRRAITAPARPAPPCS